jgi:hypothetical protein
MGCLVVVRTPWAATARDVADVLTLDSEIVEMSGGHGFGLGRAFWGHAGLPRRGHHGRADDDEAEGDDPADDG